MPARLFQSDDMPAALGPYSQAMAASGELVFVSGQSGIDPVTGKAPETFELQARGAFNNLQMVLAACGLTLGHVVKTTIYLTHPTQFMLLNQLFLEFFPVNPPARAAPTVMLPGGLLISIEAIAVAS